MAFPDITVSTAEAFGSNATAHLVTMPATVEADDLLQIFFCADGEVTITQPTGWSTVKNTGSATTGTAACTAAHFYKKAVGDEDSTTVDVVTSASEQAIAIVTRTTAASWHGTTPPESTEQKAATGTIDPPSHSVSWATGEDNLWLAVGARDDDDGISDGSTGFGSLTYGESNTGTGTAEIAIQTKEDAVDTLDPDAWTHANTNEALYGWTVAVRPAAAAGGDISISDNDAVTVSEFDKQNLLVMPDAFN